MRCVSDESHGVSYKIGAYPFVSPDLSAPAVLRSPVQLVAISGLDSFTTFPEAAVAHEVLSATLKATPAVVSQYQAASKFFAFMRSAKHIVRPFGTQIQSPTTLVPVRSLPTPIY